MSLEFKCPNCNHDVVAAFAKPGEKMICKKCESEIIVPLDAKEKVYSQSEDQSELDSKSTNDNFMALLVVSTLIKIFSWIVLIGTIVMTIVLFNEMTSYGSDITFVTILYLLIGGILSFLFLLAFSELIRLFLCIEKNTRK